MKSNESLASFSLKLIVTRDNRISCKLLYQWTSKLRSLDSSEERDGATAVNDSETGVEVRIRKCYILTMTTEKK